VPVYVGSILLYFGLLLCWFDWFCCYFLLSVPVQVIARSTVSEMIQNVERDVKPYSLTHSLTCDVTRVVNINTSHGVRYNSKTGALVLPCTRDGSSRPACHRHHSESPLHQVLCWRVQTGCSPEASLSLSLFARTVSQCLCLHVWRVEFAGFLAQT